MKSRLIGLLLLAAAAVNASAQRVTLEVPLSPAPNVSAAAVTAQPVSAAPLALSPAFWNHAGLPAASALDAKALPLRSLPAASAVAARPSPLPAPAALAAALPAANIPVGPRATPVKVIDGLREHGAKAAEVSGLDGEAGKSALESNFKAAASLGDDGIPVFPEGALPAPAKDSRPLAERLFERVRLDDRGRPEERKALEDGFRRMLATPTGARFAEEFLAEGLTAQVAFDDFPDSQLFLIEGRKRFYAAHAYTFWKENGAVEVKINRHFIDGDPEIMRETLPYVIGHELFGHGLWYGRSARENLYHAHHYHELNETLARLVGWSIDHELDGKFEEGGVWNYLDDPAYYLANLKLRLPYYSTTFNGSEMADAIGTLRSRLEPARAEIERGRRNLEAQRTWTPVIDHFATDHGIPESRFALLRQEQADLLAKYEAEIANSEAVLAEITSFLRRIESDNDEAQNYLRGASSHPLFARLVAETERLRQALLARSRGTPIAPPRAAPPRPKDQISWQELGKLYHDDVAADAKRKPGEKHWQ